MDLFDDIPLLGAQLADVRRDLRRCLADNLPKQERLYVRRMAERLGDLERILDRIEIRRIKLPGALEEQGRWDEGIRGFLQAFEGLVELRGSACGTHLERFAARLRNQPEQLRCSSADIRAGQLQKEILPRVEQPASMVKGAESKPDDRRAMVDAYITDVLAKTGERIKRKDFWTVAGYSNATEFERFQRHDSRTTGSAVDNFHRVLRMHPKEFMQTLKARKKTQ